MDNTLEKNLELRKALSEVDRLTAKIVHIESFIEKNIQDAKEKADWLYTLMKDEDDYDDKQHLYLQMRSKIDAMEIYQKILKEIPLINQYSKN
tara:strand:+ start:9631 stop:9909 length:279 start_codon:yes stop_codon:yes gene_type:complete